ncbi:hypothetical protein A374_16408 [Fictibacillus macauensis ZFHKF-1]|uniref:Uncharacterized protein n=1 Tax=Fictibacillus macauensis ZFHKF-1 TaxID=1196324 RepID=I8IY22_9BACL|nr:hypothetical protein [Fictibacillus macauensis]EIT84386.1 hypothetical protein A374_16408 [Fictibacillus macauensis ZFHKF-1]
MKYFNKKIATVIMLVSSLLFGSVATAAEPNTVSVQVSGEQMQKAKSNKKAHHKKKHHKKKHHKKKHHKKKHHKKKHHKKKQHTKKHHKKKHHKKKHHKKKHHKKKHAKPVIRKSGVFSFSKKFNKKKLIREMQSEAAYLTRMFGRALANGNKKPFYRYVNRHMNEVGFPDTAKYSYKNSVNLDREYRLKGFKQKVRVLKKVTTSQMKVHKDTRFRKDFVVLRYEFLSRKGGNYNLHYVQFDFTLQYNGRFLITGMHNF